MSERTVTFDHLISEGQLEIGAGRPRTVNMNGRTLPILRVADVLDGKIEYMAQSSPTDQPIPTELSKVSRPGDIVLTTKGTVGRVALMPADGPAFAYSPQLCYFRPAVDGPLRSRFLYYWFKSTDFWIQANALKGQTDMADFLSLGDLQRMRIRLPSVDRQDAVGDILGALDDKIAVNDRIVATTHGLAAAEHARAAQQTEREGALGEVIELAYGKALPAGQRRPGPVAVYGSGGVSGWHDQSLVHGPGIIVGRKGTVGSVYWSQQDFFPIDTTFYVKVIHERLNNEYVYFLLTRLGLSEMNSDSAVPGLNRSRALSLPICLPTEAAVLEFTKRARPLFAIREEVTRENQTLINLRDTLLPGLMSGRLRVKDAEKAAEEAV